MMQKKNIVTPSAESITPSNEALPPSTGIQVQTESSPSQLPLGSGTSVSAPSTLDVRQKVSSDRLEALKNKTRQVLLSNPIFSDENPNSAKNKEIYFNSFKKLGYTPQQINDLKTFGTNIDNSKRLYKEAVAELSEYQGKPEVSTDIQPTQGLSEEELAGADAQQNQIAAAANENTAPIKQGPIPTSLTYKAGIAALGLGKTDEAINFFTQTLGNIKAPDTGGRIIPNADLAMDIKTTYNAGDNPSNSLYGIGSAMLQQGNYKDAIDYYSQAVEADPSNSSAQKGLAYAKYKLGDRSEYKSHLKEAAKLDEAARPNLALVGQINAEAADEKEQQRQANEMKDIADMLTAFATGDREGKLGSIGFLNPIGKMIAGIQKGTETAATGVKEISEGNVTDGGLDVIGGVAHIAFSAIPEVQAFNTVLAGVNETAKQTLSPENAKFVEDTLNLPFTAASTIADNILGYKPKDGTTGKKILDLADIIVSFGAMHAIGEAGNKAMEGVDNVKNSIAERLNSFDDLKQIVKEAAEGKLSEKEMGELQQVQSAMSDITPQEILEKAKENPDLKKDVDKAVDENHVSPEAKQLEAKLEDLQKAVLNPELSTETKQLYEGTINELQSAIEELSNKETTDHVVSAESQIKLNDLDDQINVLKSDLEKATTDTEKDIINKNINSLEQEKSNIESSIVQGPEKITPPVDNKSKSGYPQTGVSVYFKNEAHSTELVDKASSEIKEKASKLEEGMEEFKKELPTETLDAESIIPTQKYVFDNKVAEYEHMPSEELPLVIKSEGKYFVEDGHNRIAADIKAGRDIKAKVYEQKEPLETAPPEKPPVENATATEPEAEKKVHSIWKNALSEIKDEELKKGIEKKGIDYIVKKDAITEASAREVVDAAIKGDKLAELEKVVLDDKNEMDNVSRGTISALLGKHYFDLAEKATDAAEKEAHYNEFHKYTDRAAALATEGGQAGNAIGKIIKKMYVNNPETVVAKVKKHFEAENEKSMEQHVEKVKNTYEAIKEILATEEGQKVVTEEIAKKSERIFGKETQKKISDLFDSAKIKNDGKVYSSIIPIPPGVINAAIEVMKQAALLGAKGAEIIEEGIRHIKENHKEEWDEKAFRSEWEKKLKDSGIKFGKKRSVTEKEKESILDAIEKKANRLNPENKEKFLKNIVQEVESEGGLSEQRFKDLYAEALGLPSMTPELIETIKGFAKTIKEGEAGEKAYLKALDDIIDAEARGASKEEIDALQAAKKEALKRSLDLSLEAKKANENLSELFKGNKKLADTLIGMMQLGALTPKSIIKNVTAMPAELAFRALSGHITGALDVLLTSMANIGLAPESWKDRKVDSFARAKGAFYAHPKAFKKMYDTFLHGSFSDDYMNFMEKKTMIREVNNKITPVRAFKNLVEGKTKGDMSATAANLVEALPQGYMAAAFGRALAGPDAFFRTIGETAKAYELGRLQGLDGAKLEKFIAEPPAEAAEVIKKEGDSITFQQDNYVSEGIKGFKSYVDRLYNKNVSKNGQPGAFTKFMTGALRVLGKSQALYIKTPTNVLASTIRMISPELSVAKAAYFLSKGNKEKFAESLADAGVAYALRYVVVSAIKNNMVTAPVDYQSKEGKAQSDEDIKHAGKFNKSAFYRMMAGGDSQEKDDDVWVDYTKWTGGLGIAMGAYANMLSDTSKEDMNVITMSKNSGKALPAVFQQVMDLSFMSTTAQLVDAMRDKDGKGGFFDKWAASTVGTLATPLVPNTVGTISKASEETKKETRDDGLFQKIKNDFKYKLFMGGDLPSKISLWGDEVKTAPTGDDRYMNYLFDVTASENPDENALSYKIMKLYKDTGDDKVLPNPPSNQITISGKKIPLNPQQFEQLQKYVGSLRKQLAQEYLNTDDYKTDDDNDRIRKLGRVYADSHKMGVDMLINSDDGLTDIKNDASGVSPVTGNRHRKPRKERPVRKRK